MEQACTHIMSASGACTKLSKRLKLGGLETGSFRNGKAKTRRSLYGVCWAGSGLSAFIWVLRKAVWVLRKADSVAKHSDIRR